MILEYEESVMIIGTIGYAISLLITLLLYKFLGHKDLKVRKIPIFILTMIILLFEIIKQIKNVIPGLNPYTMNFNNDGVSFQGYALPFHLCSFFIFFPVLSFITKGKVKDFFENMTLVWAIAITVFTVFYPQSIYGDQVREFYNGGVFSHSIFFHQSAILYLMLIIALRPYEIGIKKIWYVAVGFILYGAIAIPMAFIFKANYCSILSCDFFPVLDTIRVNYGYPVYLPILLLIGIVFGSILYLIALGVKELRKVASSELGFFIGFSITAIILIPVAFIYKSLGASSMTYIYVLMIEFIIPSFISIIIDRIIKKNKKKAVE